MRYRLHTPPVVDSTKVIDELRRLLTHARRLTITSFVVNPPYKASAMAAIALEVPDAMDPMAKRVLEVILGPTGKFTEIREPLPLRPEWSHCALLVPRRNAEPLDITTITNWSSAGLQCSWSGQRANAIIWHTEHDAKHVAALSERGWYVKRIAPRVASLATVVNGRYAHGPHIPWPENTAASQDPEHASVTSNTPTTDTSRQVTGSVPSNTWPSVLATDPERGLALGTTVDGEAVALTMHAVTAALDLPHDAQQTFVETLVVRALNRGMGVVAVLPQSLYRSRVWKPLEARLRVLDGRDLSESAAIPWKAIAPTHLQTALVHAGITAALPVTRPDTFGELLSMLPKGQAFCRPDVLGLTANPGDALRDVVAAGGAVVLITNETSTRDLLGDLLLAATCAPQAPNRPVLLIRPSTITPPTELANVAIQVVLGTDRDALTTVCATTDGWQMIHRDGAPPTMLDRDLHRTSSAAGVNDYQVLVNALTPESTTVPPAEAPVLGIDALTSPAEAPVLALSTPATTEAATTEGVFTDIFALDLNTGLSNLEPAAPSIDAGLADAHPDQLHASDAHTNTTPDIGEQTDIIPVTPSYERIADEPQPEAPSYADETPIAADTLPIGQDSTEHGWNAGWLNDLWEPAAFPQIEDPAPFVVHAPSAETDSGFPARVPEPNDDSLFPARPCESAPKNVDVTQTSVPTIDSLFPDGDNVQCSSADLFPSSDSHPAATDAGRTASDDAHVEEEAPFDQFVDTVDDSFPVHTFDETRADDPEVELDSAQPVATAPVRGPASYQRVRIAWQRARRRNDNTIEHAHELLDAINTQITGITDAAPFGEPDPVTQALVRGDLDPVDTTLFDGPEFMLAPFEVPEFDDAARVAIADGILAPTEPSASSMSDLHPIRVPVTKQPGAPVPHDDAAPMFLMTTPDDRLPTSDGVLVPSEETESPASRIHPMLVPVTEQPSEPLPHDDGAPLFLVTTTTDSFPLQQSSAVATTEPPTAVSSAHTAPPLLAHQEEPPLAEPSLRFDAELLKHLWSTGTGITQLIQLVCRANPDAQPHIVRRAIRAVIAAAPPPPFLPSTPAHPMHAEEVSQRVDEPTPDAGASEPLGTITERIQQIDVQYLQQPVSSTHRSNGALDVTGPVEVLPPMVVLNDEPDASAHDVEAPFDTLLEPVPNTNDDLTSWFALLGQQNNDDPATEDAFPSPPVSDATLVHRWQEGARRIELETLVCTTHPDLTADAAVAYVDRVIAPLVVEQFDADLIIKRLERGRAPMPLQQERYTQLMCRFADMDIVDALPTVQQRLLDGLAAAHQGVEVL